MFGKLTVVYFWRRDKRIKLVPDRMPVVHYYRRDSGRDAVL